MTPSLFDPNQTRVAELQSSPVVSVPPTLSLLELETFLLENGVGGAPVVDGGKLVGVVSRADVLRQLEVSRTWAGMLGDYYRAQDGIAGAGELSSEQRLSLESSEIERLSTTRVADVMNREVISVAADASIAEAARRMTQHRVHRVIVQRDGEPTGILTTSDLTGWLATVCD